MKFLLPIVGLLLLVTSVSAQTPGTEGRKTLVSRDPKAPLPAPTVKEPAAPVEDEDDDDMPDCRDESILRIRFIGDLGGFSEEQLFEAMTDYQRFRTAPHARRYCLDVYEDRDLPRLEAFFKKQGFPETTLELPSDFDSSSSELIVRVNVRRPAVVGKVTAFGVESLSYGLVVGTLTPGEAAVVSRGNQMYRDSGPRPDDTRLRIENVVAELYRKAGFADAYVMVWPTFQNRRTGDEKELVDFEIFVEERPPGIVRTVEMTGNLVSRDRVIRRELFIGEGAPFSRVLLDRSLENIRRLGLFSEVAVKEIRINGEKGTVDITISVVDTPETIRKAKAEGNLP